MKTTRVLFFISMGLALIGIGLVGAQDATPTMSPTATLAEAASAPTEEIMPSAEPSVILESAETTALVTVEVLPPASPTIDSTPELVLEATSEITAPVMLPSATATTDAPLRLVVRDLFDTLDHNAWVIDPAWVLNEGTAQALQDAMMSLRHAPWHGVAVQAKVYLVPQTLALITVRGGEAGGYSASLNADGTLVLYRYEIAVQTAVLPNKAQGWHTLDLMAIDGQIRIAVDGVEMIVWDDAMPLPAGTVSLAVQLTPGTETTSEARIDDVFVWLTEQEWAAHQTPAATATLIPTNTAVVSSTEDVSEAIFASPTVTVMPFPTLSPTPYVDANGKVAGNWPPSGDTSAQAADNDDFVDADVINNPMSMTYTAVGNTNGATLEAGEPQPSCGFNVTNTIWFHFTPQTNGTYTLSTAGSLFDTVLAVYTGDSVIGLTQIACNDDIVPAANVLSRLTLNMRANQTVRIQLSGYGGNYGPFTLTIERSATAAPLAPILVGPVTNAFVNNDTFVLQWQAPATGSTPLAYWLEIDNTPTFSSPEFTASIDHTSGLHAFEVPDNALLDGSYSWRIRTYNYNGQSSLPSAVRALKLDTMPFDPPVLSAPANMAFMTMPRPALAWKAITGAALYRVDIARDEFFTDFVLLGTETSLPTLSLTSAILSQPLTQGQYYWRVAVRDVAGNWSDDSTSRSFQVNFGTAPAANAIITSSTTVRPIFTWASSTILNSTYKLEIALDSDFTAWVYETPSLITLTHTIPAVNALTPGIYYYRIWVNGVTPKPGVYKKFTVSPAAPPAPGSISPATGAIMPAANLVLQWGTPPVTVLGGPFTYEYQVDNQSTFATPESFASGLNDPFVAGLGLGDGVYYWRARTVNAFGVPGPWILTRQFTLDSVAPDGPTLISPVQQGLISTTRPAFKWQAITGVNRYRFDLSTTENFSVMVVEDVESATPTLTLSSVILAQPLRQDHYYWRVSARDLAGNWGDESSIFGFSVDLATAPLPKYAYVVASKAQPKFTWAAFGVLGTTYNVEISTNEFFSGSFVSPNLTTLTYTLPVADALSHGHYFWRIWINGMPQQARREFSVTPSLPAKPVPIGPATASIVPAPPNLSWKPVSGDIDHYEVQVDNTATFVSPEQNATTYSTELLVDIALPAGLYSWRVRAINTFFAPGPWSTAQTFTLDIQPPLAPVVVGPADGSSVATLQPAFTWKSSAGARRYLLQLSTTATFDLPILYPIAPVGLALTSPTVTLKPTSALLVTTYWWRVAAMDAAGNVSDWSPTRVITIQSPVNVAPLPNRYVSGSPLLTWTPVSWSQGYHVMISTTPTFVGLPTWEDNTIPSTETGVMVSASLANGTYYWRIRARSGPTTWGAWSTNGVLVIESP